MRKDRRMIMAALIAMGAAAFSLTGCSGAKGSREAAGEKAQTQVETAGREEASSDEQATETAGERDETADSNSEKKESAQEAPQVIIETREEKRLAEDGTTVLVNGTFDRVSISGTGYEKVAQAVSQWSKEAEDAFVLSLDDYAAMAKEDALTRGSDFDFYGYSAGRQMEIARADNRAVSFKYLVSDYTGGAHGNYGYFGETFDAQDGRRLLLGDLVENEKEFKQKALEFCLKELGERKEETGLFDDYQQTLRQSWEDGTDPVWYLDAAGITLVFNPYEIGPYAAGVIYVTLPYSEFSQEIKEQYQEMGDIGVGAVPVNVNVPLTFGDGQSEPRTLRLSMKSKGENYAERDLYLEIGGKEEKAETFERLGHAYLIRKGDDRTYLIFDGDYASDDFVTFVYDVTGDAAQRTDQSDMGISISPSDVNTETLKLNMVINVLGTYRAAADYHIDSQGKLVNDSEVYNVNANRWSTNSLTVKRELPVIVGGEKTAIEPGAQITITGTDNESIVYFRASDSGLDGEIHFTRGQGDNSWQIYIDGVEDNQYFDNLPYAG